VVAAVKEGLHTVSYCADCCARALELPLDVVVSYNSLVTSVRIERAFAGAAGNKRARY